LKSWGEENFLGFEGGRTCHPELRGLGLKGGRGRKKKTRSWKARVSIGIKWGGERGGEAFG